MAGHDLPKVICVSRGTFVQCDFTRQPRIGTTDHDPSGHRAQSPLGRPIETGRARRRTLPRVVSPVIRQPDRATQSAAATIAAAPAIICGVGTSEKTR